MTIFLVGGSNSIIRPGWVSDLEAHYPDVVNLGAGATTSLTGLYRLLTRDDLEPGDTVIWEYALNDANHFIFWNKDLVSSFAEHTFRLAMRRRLKVAPVIFTPYHLEKNVGRSRYYGRLHGLLRHYGLPNFDVSRELRERDSVKTLPNTYYKDPNHYDYTTEMVQFLTGGIQRVVSEAKVPRLRPAVYSHGEPLEVIAGFGRQHFKNSLMELTGNTPPFDLRLPRWAKPIGIGLITSEVQSSVDILSDRSAGKTWQCSLRSTGEGPQKLFGTFPFANMSKRNDAPPAGSKLSFQMGQSVGMVHGPQFSKRTLDHASTTTDAMITGVIVARQVWFRPLLNTLWLKALYYRRRMIAKLT